MIRIRMLFSHTTKNAGSIKTSLSRIQVFVLSFAVFGCQTLPEIEQTDVPPSIESLVDLGYYPDKLNRKLSRIKPDAVIYPGEWVAIFGKGLTDAKVLINGVDTVVEKAEHKELIFRVPSGLEKYHEHRLLVTTEYGSAEKSFETSHYIAAADLDDGKISFMRVHKNDKEFVESRAGEINQTKPMFLDVSDDGATLISIGLDGKVFKGTPEHPYAMQIYYISLVSDNTPKIIGEQQFNIKTTPTSAAFSGEKIAILGKEDLLLLRKTDERSYETISRLTLGSPSPEETKNFVDGHVYNDVAFLGDGYLALLETRHNYLTLVDIREADNPKILSHKKILENADWPSTVDLHTDVNDPNKLWVLAGRNLKNFTRKTFEALRKFTGKEVDFVDDAEFSYLLEFDLVAEEFSEVNRIPLPEKQAPFFVTQDENGEIFVSALEWDFAELADTESSWGANIKRYIASALNTGKIYTVDPTTEDVSIESQGLGIYYHLDADVKLGPVFTIAKMGPKMLPPFVTIKWGLAVDSFGTYVYRGYDKTAFYPPYSLGQIAIQD